MSDECNSCGEHTLECVCKKRSPGPKDKFYYQGKFFENENEFWDYVKYFNSRQTTVEDFNALFDLMKQDIWMNLAMRKTKINNAELRSILEDVFMTILEKSWKENEMD